MHIQYTARHEPGWKTKVKGYTSPPHHPEHFGLLFTASRADGRGRHINAKRPPATAAKSFPGIQRAGSLRLRGGVAQVALPTGIFFKLTRLKVERKEACNLLFQKGSRGKGSRTRSSILARVTYIHSGLVGTLRGTYSGTLLRPFYFFLIFKVPLRERP